MQIYCMINFGKNQKEKSSARCCPRGALLETKRLGRELLLPVVCEFVDDLVDSAHIAFQTVERLADNVAGEVIAVFAIERLTSIHARLVAVLGEYLEHLSLILRDADVVAWVLELANPIQHRFLVGEVEIRQLFHQGVGFPLRFFFSLLAFTSRTLAFGRASVGFGGFRNLRLETANNILGGRVFGSREFDVVKLRSHTSLCLLRQGDHSFSSCADVLTGHRFVGLHATVSFLLLGTCCYRVTIARLSIRVKCSIIWAISQAQTKNQHFCCFYGLKLADSWTKKFSSPKMRNRQFVFAPKIEYQLVAERSEANQNSLTFPMWCTQ